MGCKKCWQLFSVITVGAVTKHKETLAKELARQ